MAVAQQGIFAQGARAHYQLEFSVFTDASLDAIRAALGRLREPTAVAELGLYFVAFSADLDRFTIMLGRMFGTSGDGLSDRLVSFTKPVTGSFFVIPSVEVLAEIG